MPATVPPAADQRELRPADNTVDSDQDAEGEEADLYQMDQQLQDAVHRAYSGEVAAEMGAEVDEDLDAEGEVDYDHLPDGEVDEAEPVGAVKIPDGAPSLNNDDDVDADADADEDPEFDEQSDSEREGSSSSSSRESDEEWEAESNGRAEVDADNNTIRGNCIFCNQDEDHDPSEEFEEYMSCAVCGDHSHRQCARENNALSETDDTEPWRCPTCYSENLEPSSKDDDGSLRRKNGPKNMSKELLPAHTGEKDSSFHSIFNTVTVDDELLNSSRSLRKRKTQSVDPEEHAPFLRKRSRPSPMRIEQDASQDQNKEDGDGLSPVRTRSRRTTRKDEQEHCRIVLKQFGKLVVAFRVNDTKLAKILNSRARSSIRNRKIPKPPPAQEPQAHFAPITPASYFPSLYSFSDRDLEESSKSKPYGGILSETDADTTKTLPSHSDRERFEVARRKAEEAWQARLLEADTAGEAAQHASQKVSGPPSRIKYINFGGYEIETWYAAPYPEEYSRNRVLYICEFCLKYMNSDYVAWRHKLKCPAKHPPGDEIYREGSIAIFEVDGRKNPVYCQNLCLLAKLFLGSKTLYYDVEPFLFYVMSECDDLGCHFVGYFSKEKRPSSANNVSCILTLPIHQRKGYGNLLIDFSYLLTRIEGKTGSPEKPLSDMGLVSYRNYWRLVLSYQLRNQKTSISIAEISERTGMTADDVVSGLEALRALVRDPVTKTYALRLDYNYFEECIRGWESKGYVTLNPDALVWTPYIMGRNNQSQFDRAPIHTVAPREGLEDEEDEVKEPVEEVSKQSETSKRDGQLLANGTSHTADEGPLLEPAGPPSTDLLSNANGIVNQAPTEVAATNPEKPPEPEIPSIPAWRFEVYPPVQAPILKKRAGRPFGSKSFQKVSITPTTTRTSGRSTPRRVTTLSTITPTANESSVRRGRSAKLFDSPSVDSESVATNGLETDQLDIAGETGTLGERETAPRKDEALEHEGQASVENAPDDKVSPTTNGINGPVTVEEQQPVTPSRRRGVESTAKLTRSASRKSVVEKIEMLIPAEDEGVAINDNSGHLHDSDADAEGDIVMDEA